MFGSFVVVVVVSLLFFIMVFAWVGSEWGGGRGLMLLFVFSSQRKDLLRPNNPSIHR